MAPDKEGKDQAYVPPGAEPLSKNAESANAVLEELRATGVIMSIAERVAHILQQGDFAAAAQKKASQVGDEALQRAADAAQKAADDVFKDAA
jgi:hypothetical protein